MATQQVNDPEQNAERRHRQAMAASILAILATLAAGFIPYFLGRSETKGTTVSFAATYIIGIAKVVGVSDQLHQVYSISSPSVPPTQAATAAAPAAPPPSAAPLPTDPASAAKIQGLAPYFEVLDASVLPVRDGYNVTLTIRNNSDKPLALLAENGGQLDDDRQHDLVNWRSNLPYSFCDLQDARCRQNEFIQGTRIEPKATAAISYVFLGLNQDKTGATVTINTKLVCLWEQGDEKATGIRLVLSGVGLPVRQ